jgi:hypothetical protein
MLLAIIYQLQPSGFWSNLGMLAGVLFFSVIAAYFLLIILNSIHDSVHHRGDAKIWRHAVGVLLSLISIIAMAVISAVAGSSGSSGGAARSMSEGATQGYVRSKGTSPNIMLAVSLLGIPLIVCAIVTGVFHEKPLAVSVTPDAVDFIYRLPWRHESLKMAQIQSANLEHKYARASGGFTYDYYTIVLNHDGVGTHIYSADSPWYEQQLKAAYAAIEAHLKPTLAQGNKPPSPSYSQKGEN